jgi:hypothetical protein
MNNYIGRIEMPAKSKAELKYLFVHEPKVAKEFASKTKNIKALPEHVNKKSSKRKK